MKIFSIYTDYNEENQPKGCGWYRIVQPMESLQRKGFDVSINGKIRQKKWSLTGLREETKEEQWTRIFENADVLFIQHFDGREAFSQIFGAREYFKKPVILDIDDDITCVEHVNPCHQDWGKGEGRRLETEAAIHYADALIVSTENLKKVYSKLNKNTYVLENRINPSDWNYVPTRILDGKVRIGYAGSVSHIGDYNMVHPYIKKILKKYKFAKFCVVGFKSPLMDELPKDQFEFKVGTPKYNFKTWPKSLAESGFDIGICPLEKNKFNEGKSPIKYFEYSMYAIPTIASRDTTLPYYKVIKDKDTGLLASYETEWVRSLEMLIEEQEIRETLGQRAQEHVLNSYTMDDYSEKYLDVFREVLSYNTRNWNLKSEDLLASQTH